ncbi:hypothetical protein [Muriicola soli]|uniref:hypothetical protein n=1 Tax=Muriicola soli TaxID=2507538 RepID=UPI0013EA486A|nr:hypothetical protein [Muriicola soli]
MEEQKGNRVVRQGTISPSVVQIHLTEALVALRNNIYLKENLGLWAKVIKAVNEGK